MKKCVFSILNFWAGFRCSQDGNYFALFFRDVKFCQNSQLSRQVFTGMETRKFSERKRKEDDCYVYSYLRSEKKKKLESKKEELLTKEKVLNCNVNNVTVRHIAREVQLETSNFLKRKHSDIEEKCISSSYKIRALLETQSRFNRTYEKVDKIIIPSYLSFKDKASLKTKLFFSSQNVHNYSVKKNAAVNKMSINEDKNCTKRVKTFREKPISFKNYGNEDKNITKRVKAFGEKPFSFKNDAILKTKLFVNSKTSNKNFIKCCTIEKTKKRLKNSK